MLTHGKFNNQEDYPKFEISTAADELNMLFTKSDVWAYEDEYRLICPRLATAPNHPLNIVGDYLPLRPETLQAVVVGCQSKNYEAIRDLVNVHAPTVSVMRAFRSPNKYRLVMEPDT